MQLLPAVLWLPRQVTRFTTRIYSQDSYNTKNCFPVVLFKFNLLDALRLVKLSWQNVTERTILHCYRHCRFVSETPEQRTYEPDGAESEITTAWSRLQHAGLLLVEDVSINDSVDVDAATAVCESPDDLAVQHTNNQSEDQVVSDDEFIKLKALSRYLSSHLSIVWRHW